MSDLKTILEQLPYLSDADLAEVRDAAVSLLGRLGTNGLTADEQEALASHDLMRCVKLIRQRTGLGLRDAKNIMDHAKNIMDHARSGGRS